MVAAAAREIRDGAMVFVGMRLPLLGFAVAKEIHAPNARYLRTASFAIGRRWSRSSP
jgi:acyl CoA:acetate/3-ketoacid CoA transferase beta subunit